MKTDADSIPGEDNASDGTKRGKFARCEIVPCKKKVQRSIDGKRVCDMHYWRFKRNGDFHTVKKYRRFRRRPEFKS